jgi:hypothetical protein
MSVFKVDPKNILGLDHSKFKSQMLAMALAEPHTYFRLREKVYTSIVENAVKDAYNLYWNILKYGKLTDGGAPLEIPTEKYRDDGGAAKFVFAPNLPESEINSYALQVAESIKRSARIV